MSKLELLMDALIAALLVELLMRAIESYLADKDGG
jgi:hypothetical protein